MKSFKKGKNKASAICITEFQQSKICSLIIFHIFRCMNKREDRLIKMQQTLMVPPSLE